MLIYAYDRYIPVSELHIFLVHRVVLCLPKNVVSYLI